MSKKPMKHKKLLDEMAVIADAIGQELNEANPNPAMLLRLNAAASMQCLTGLILLLGGEIESKPAADDGQKAG